MFSFILGSVGTATNNFILSVWGGFWTTFGITVDIIAAVFVAVVGYLIWMGKIQISINSLFPQFRRLAVIYVMVRDAAIYKYLGSIGKSFEEFGLQRQ